MTTIRKLTYTEIAIIDALVKNDFIVGNAALDLGIRQSRISHTLKNITEKYPRGSSLFILPHGMKGKKGSKKVTGLSYKGLLLYKEHIAPLVRHYDMIESAIREEEELL